MPQKKAGDHKKSSHTFSNSVLGIAERLVNVVLVLEHERSQDLGVDDVGATVFARNHGPDQEQTLKQTFIALKKLLFKHSAKREVNFTLDS